MSLVTLVTGGRGCHLRLASKSRYSLLERTVGHIERVCSHFENHISRPRGTFLFPYLVMSNATLPPSNPKRPKSPRRSLQSEKKSSEWIRDDPQFPFLLRREGGQWYHPLRGCSSRGNRSHSASFFRTKVIIIYERMYDIQTFRKLNFASFPILATSVADVRYRRRFLSFRTCLS